MATPQPDLLFSGSGVSSVLSQGLECQLHLFMLNTLVSNRTHDEIASFRSCRATNTT